MTRNLITQKNLAAALLTLALALSAWMARTAFQQAGLVGCGRSCSEVLSSPWAYVGNLPVSVPGGMLYLATLLFCLLGKQGPARVLSAIILAGALYFVVIQAAVLRALCPWCGITHLLASSAAILVLRVFPARDQPRRALIPVVSAGLAIALLFGAQILAPRKAGSMAAASPKTDYLVPMAGGQWTAHGRIQFTPSAFPSLIPSQAGEAGAPVLFLHDWTCSHCRQLHHDLAALDARERPSIFLIPASREAEGKAVHKLMTTAWVVDPALYERTAAALLAGTLQAVPADVVQALGTMQPSQEQSARADHLLAIGESILSENDNRLPVAVLPQLLSRHDLLTGSPAAEPLAVFIRNSHGSGSPQPAPAGSSSSVSANAPAAPANPTATAAPATVPAPATATATTTDNPGAPDEATPRNASRIEFENTMVRLPAQKAGKTASAAYAFKNTGRDPLTITGVKPSCGCTAVDGWQQTVPPGGTGRFQVTFDGKGQKPGMHAKSVIVRSTAENTDPVSGGTALSLLATILPDKEEPAAEGSRKAPLLASETQLAYGILTGGVAGPDRKIYLNLTDENYTLTPADIKVPPFLSHALLAENQKGAFTLILSLPILTEGTLNAEILIAPQAAGVATPVQPLRIATAGYVKSGKPMELSHREIQLPSLPLAEPYLFEAFLRLAEAGKAKPAPEWSWSSASALTKDVQVSLSPADAGEPGSGNYRIKLIFPKGWGTEAAGSALPALEFTRADPGGEPLHLTLPLLSRSVAPRNALESLLASPPSVQAAPAGP